MTTVDLSVVVPTFRGASRLPVLFEAMRVQDFSGSWELIVVVDGVVDNSVEVAHAATDLPVRVVVLEENQGRSAALNAGFESAEGSVFIRCDDDLAPSANYLSEQARAHEGSDPVGVVGLYRNVYGDTPYGRVYGCRYDAQVRAGAYSGALGDSWLMWAGNCSVTREVFARVGPYDESFTRYGWEDIDWGYRLVQIGVPIALEPALETIHHAANIDVATRVRRAHASGVARARFDAKHGTNYLGAATLGAKASTWSALVDGLSRLTPSQFARMASRIDLTLTVLPEAHAYRMICLLVDAAARAGYLEGKGAIE